MTGAGRCRRAFSAACGLALLASCATPQASCDKDYAALKSEEIREIKAGEAVLRKVIVDKAPEDSLTSEEVAAAERMEAVQESRSRVVDEIDLKILLRASEILFGPGVWDRADDRECGAEDAIFSLFCALKRASEDVAGEYEHRRTALQEVRFAIEDQRPGVEYEHRLRDFNNAPDTTFEDVKAVLAVARARVAARLDLQARCAL